VEPFFSGLALDKMILQAVVVKADELWKFGCPKNCCELGELKRRKS